MDALELLAGSIELLEIATVGIALFFLLSGLDDLFIDLVYAVRAVYRRLVIQPRYAPLPAELLRSMPERQLAVLVPAWDESAVIQPMLRNLLGRVEYGRYAIFVGTYPNDAATIREVDAVCADDPRVHRIELPHPGPTTKADCLNWVYRGILAHEERTGIHYEGFVMQDCEDVLHPLCYKLIGHLIGRIDMVQLPVLSLERHWWEFTGGHYLDEFAQLHYKDLVVRETLDHSLPAAGVGCAFSRRALECVGADQRGAIFNTSSLTEDYDLGLRLQAHGLRQAFVKYFVEHMELKRHPLTGVLRPRRVRELVCVREYFPGTFRTAVRQKSRWVLGISLQGWKQIGWKGSGWRRYMLWRDRKALLTNPVNVLGYLLLPLVLGVWLASLWWPQTVRGMPLLEQPWVRSLLLLNTGLLCTRLLQRMYCVAQLYNRTQALLSVPRAIWGNFINFAATLRAVRQFIHSLRTGQAVAWDKTAHVYPTLPLPEAVPALAAPRPALALVHRRQVPHPTPGQARAQIQGPMPRNTTQTHRPPQDEHPERSLPVPGIS